MPFPFLKAGSAAFLLALAVPAFATGPQPAAAAPKSHQAVMPSHLSKAEQARLVDVNKAPKEVLLKLMGIDSATADQIIKGRPYLSKANLITRKIITMDQYQAIREHIKVSITKMPAFPAKK